MLSWDLAWLPINSITGDIAEPSENRKTLSLYNQAENITNVETFPKKRGVFGMLPLRRMAADTARQMVDTLADQLNRMPIQFRIEVKKMKGDLLFWVFSPPSDRYNAVLDNSCNDKKIEWSTNDNRWGW